MTILFKMPRKSNVCFTTLWNTQRLLDSNLSPLAQTVRALGQTVRRSGHSVRTLGQTISYPIVF